MKENKNILYVYPNQKIITVCNDMKDREQKDGNTYGCITREAARLAAKNLNDGTAAYILYTHLALSQDGYTFALSPQALFNDLGITRNQYDRAIKKLKQSGYLIKDRGNKYTFYTLPQILNDVKQTSPHADDIPSPVDEGIPLAENSINFDVDSNVKSRDTLIEIIPNNTLNNTLNNNIIGGKINEKEKIINQKENNNSNSSEDFIINNQKENKDNKSKNEDLAEWISNPLSHNQKQDSSVLGNASIIDNEYQNKIATVKDESFRQNFVVADEIIEIYLNEHPETPEEKKQGDKYGRFILGWDCITQQPIVKRATEYVPDNAIIFNTRDIPRSYLDKYKRIKSSDNDLPF